MWADKRLPRLSLIDPSATFAASGSSPQSRRSRDLLGAANLAGNPAKKYRPGRANAVLEARQGRLRHKHGSALGPALGLSVQAAVQVSQRRADRLAASAGGGMVTP